MCHCSRGLKIRSPGIANHQGVPKHRPDATLKDEAIFILAVVSMYRSRQGARLYRMIYEREALVSIASFND